MCINRFVHFLQKRISVYLSYLLTRHVKFSYRWFNVTASAEHGVAYGVNLYILNLDSRPLTLINSISQNNNKN